MKERSYTVKEIDDLRSVCRCRFIFGTCVLVKSQGSHGYPADVEQKAVEEIVRTHMIAGHVAQDLIDEDQRKSAERNTA